MENNANTGPEERTHECRICKDSQNSEQMISPCNCIGSMKYTHKTCLLTWIMTTNDERCRVCHSVYTNLQVRRLDFWSYIRHEFSQLLSILLITLFISSIFLWSAYLLLRMDLDSYNRMMAKQIGVQQEFKRYSNLREFYIFKGIVIVENLVAFVALWVLFAIAVRDDWNQHIVYFIEDRDINI